MTKTNNKKLNTELITSLSNEDYRKLVDKDYQNQFQMGGYMCTIISNEKGYRNWDGMYWVDSDEKYAMCQNSGKDALRKLSGKIICKGCGAETNSKVKWIIGYKP